MRFLTINRLKSAQKEESPVRLFLPIYPTLVIELLRYGLRDFDEPLNTQYT